jgi:hypothetical protein
MRSMIVFGVATLWICTPALACSQVQCVGEVTVMGNPFTPDYVIRRALQDLQPGQILRNSDVPSAEKKLNSLGLFRPGATVRVLAGPGPFKDILVQVEEQPLNWLYFAAWDVLLFRNSWDVDYLYDFERQIRNGIAVRHAGKLD